MSKPFHFKQFSIQHENSAFKVGTDGVLLGAWAGVSGAKRILDIGTGTGLIALMLAQRNHEAIVHGVEMHEASFEEAIINKENSPWSERVSFFHSKVQDYQSGKYDLIVSNPPYFVNSTKANEQGKHSAKHTDTLTHEELLQAVLRLISVKGKFCLVLPTAEAEQLIKEANTVGLFCNKLLKVKPKKDISVERYLMEFSFLDKGRQEEELIIQFEKRNDFTPEYITLTKGFYTIM